MNRQTKRMMGAGGSTPPRRPTPGAQKKERTSPRQFFREVRQELKKVNWPTRRELFAYTVVVLVTVVVLTSLVFGIDFLVGKAVLQVFGDS